MPTEAAKHIAMGLTESFGISILGFAIVFVVLIALMFMIGVLRSILERMDAARAAAAPAPKAPAPAKPAAGMVPAKGSLGEVMLHSVDDKTAAMLMAIVADTMQAPLNELRFISIREKK